MWVASAYGIASTALLPLSGGLSEVCATFFDLKRSVSLVMMVKT